MTKFQDTLQGIFCPGGEFHTVSGLEKEARRGNGGGEGGVRRRRSGRRAAAATARRAGHAAGKAKAMAVKWPWPWNGKAAAWKDGAVGVRQWRS